MRMLIWTIVGVLVLFAIFAGLWRWNTRPVLIVVDAPLPADYAVEFMPYDWSVNVTNPS